MKIIMEIPEEFVQHYEKDRFVDALQRLKIDAHCLAGTYEKETADMLCEALKTSDILDEDKILIPSK